MSRLAVPDRQPRQTCYNEDVSQPYDHSRFDELRRSYGSQGLSEGDLAPDPFQQFAVWMGDAVAARLREPNAMVLATADSRAQPSARTVLLKSVDERGFVFFTNHTSRKGRELSANPYASLVFPWMELERQVVVVGEVVRIAEDEVRTYFQSRPHGSQLGSWASRQSSVLTSRAELDEHYATLAAQWPEGVEVPVPEFWGGYRVLPLTVEFWQGRANRLHDRLRFRRESVDSSSWLVERLAP
jgi:pyridoxamine 5'-phosphate oxidase